MSTLIECPKKNEICVCRDNIEINKKEEKKKEEKKKFTPTCTK